MKHIIQSGLGLKFINHQTYLVILDEVARVGVSPGWSDISIELL